MTHSLRYKIALWFLIVVVAVGVAGLVGFKRLAGYIRVEAQNQMASKLDHVLDVMESTDKIYSELATSAMHVMKMLSKQLGAPRLEAADGGLPRLIFGETCLNDDPGFVDHVIEVMGGTATAFVLRGGDFVRVSTNVRLDNGERATGTVLDPDGPAATALRAGKSYSGVADILGHPFITRYEPLKNAEGQLIGALYVGYPLDTLYTIRDALEDQGLLKRGFFILLDSRQQVVFRTKHVSESAVRQTIAVATGKSDREDPTWLLRGADFKPWNYMVIAALYEPDVTRITWTFIRQVYGVEAFIILIVLVVSFWLASRLSGALEAAESARSEAVAARNAAESANRTKSAFLANMSHELRTPMNAIIGYSEMLIEEAEDLGVEGFAPDLQKIRSAGKHLLALINDVLDLSKIEAGKMTLFLEDFDVADMVRDVAGTIQPLVEKNGNALTIAVAPECGKMHADLTKVRQTLFNLLSNAAKFTEKGTIRLSVSRTADAGRMSFEVEDSGIGMTPEQLGKLFQAFTQADDSTTKKYGGTGLGLVISRKFCQIMGGDISVRSALGRGTTFAVDLPVEVTGLHEAAAPAPQPLPHSPDARRLVLVIDDDADASALLKRHLVKSGYDVVTASNGREGIDTAKQLHPSAITLDIMMPGMDGWSVLAELKADPGLAPIPVILVTMLHDRQMGFSLGASEFLTKPVDPAQFAAVLGRYCGPQKSRVLVVEDDAGNRELMVRMLEKGRYQVSAAENGSAALASLATQRPDLILLDLMMPVMDGFTFLESLRQNPAFASIPVVVITAKDLSQADRDVLRGNVQHIIQKGAVNREKLLREISETIAQHTTHG